MSNVTIDAEQPSLFDNVDDIERKVRAKDPRTSTVAATQMKTPAAESLKAAILRLLKSHGPMTDDALFARYQAEGGSRTVQRVRTSRHEMSTLGVPSVRATGETRSSANGGDAQVWEAI